MGDIYYNIRRNYLCEDRKEDTMKNLKRRGLELILEFGPRIVMALLIVVIGFAVINRVIRTFDKRLNKHKIDQSLHSFIKSISSFMLKAIILMIAASVMNIPLATFITILSAAGLAIGLALKDSLANFAGGILILIFRPFNVGDFIDLEGAMGTVKEIQLLYTALNTTDNRRITIPNSQLANGRIINFSKEKTRRLDLIFSVSYEDDIQKVKAVLMRIVNNHPFVFKDPEPLVRAMTYGDYSIDFTIKVWCQRENYWSIYYDLHEQVKDAFDQEGIFIPFPQKDVHIYQKQKEVL